MCVSRLTIIGSDNGLSPGRPQAIIWTSDGIGNFNIADCDQKFCMYNVWNKDICMLLAFDDPGILPQL